MFIRLIHTELINHLYNNALTIEEEHNLIISNFGTNLQITN